MFKSIQSSQVSFLIAFYGLFSSSLVYNSISHSLELEAIHAHFQQFNFSQFKLLNISKRPSSPSAVRVPKDFFV